MEAVTPSSEDETYQSKIMFYPNPTEGLVNIFVDGSANYEVAVYSSSGVKLLGKQNSDLIDLSEYPSGIYTVTVISDKQMHHQMIIKR